MPNLVPVVDLDKEEVFEDSDSSSGSSEKEGWAGRLLNAQLWDDAHTLCSTENKRVYIEQRLVYTPAAQRISE